MLRTDKNTLEWRDLFKIMDRDKAGRWYSDNDAADEYIDLHNYRWPSRKWPYSHARALMTKKYAKWLVENHPSEALALGLLSNSASETGEVRDFTIMITPLENQLMDNHG